MEQIPSEANPTLRERLREPHRPSRKQAVIFLILTLLIAGGVAVWELYFNFGTLALTSDKPFHASVATQAVFCEAPPCYLKLKPKTYTVLFQREGYYDDTHVVELPRFKEATLEPAFIFIPTLEKLKGSGLDGIFPLSSLKTAPTTLPRFPETVQSIDFNPTATQAVVAVDKDLYLYDVASKTINKLSISQGIPFAWNGGSLIFLADVKGGGQALLNYGAESDTPLVAFDRPLVNAKLFGSPEYSYVLIEEDAEGVHTYYLINTKDLTRKRLTIEGTYSFVGYAGIYGIFETVNEDKEKIYHLVTLEGEEDVVIPNAAFPAAAVQDKKVYFMSTVRSDKNETSSGVSIEDAITQISDNLSDATKSTTPVDPQVVPNVTYYLTMLDLETKKITTIAPLVLKEGQKNVDIAVLEGKVLVRVGEVLYTLKTQ